MIEQKRVAVIGGGVAGIAAAEELTRWGISVTIIEKAPWIGGHAIQLGCKATDRCVKCGACLVQERLQRIADKDRFHVLAGTRIERVEGEGGFSLTYQREPACVDDQKCDACGKCLPECPRAGALVRSDHILARPRVTLRSEWCRYFEDQSCTLCRDACPRGAIDLTAQAASGTLKVDALLVTSGFSPYDPTEKPYGYGRFPNVVTNLDAEKILQRWDSLIRPSDGKIPRRIAFVQCVGSRDNRVGHPWCSRVCCGSALRMANLVLHRRPDTVVTFFYIDVQTFGKDFQLFYDQIRDRIRMIRAIPGDIVAADNDQLQLAYFDPQTHTSIEEQYDLAVLSVGLGPSSDNPTLANMFGLGLTADGFLAPHAPTFDSPRGVFAAGSLLGPMSIAESIDSAGKAAWEIVSFFQEESADG